MSEKYFCNMSNIFNNIDDVLYKEENSQIKKLSEVICVSFFYKIK